MENRKKGFVGYRKFAATMIAISCIMLSGYTMKNEALSPVVWGVVSALGVFLTGSVIKGINNKNHNYGNEEHYIDQEPEY